MADIFYGLDRGQSEFAVTEDSSSPGLDVEICVDLAVSLTKSEVLQLIDMLKNHMLKNASGVLKDGA